MTNKELLDRGIAGLKEKGIPDAETDARILFEHLTGLERGDMLLKGQETAAVETVSAYEALVEKRKTRYPVQYITGMADFMGLRFIVNESVLIPRFDTEFLVEEMMKDIGDGSSILDMCTGSGCILLSFMRYKNGIRGTGADISEAALKIAKENEKIIFGTKASPADNVNAGDGLHDAVEWILTDMFENVTGIYDCIVSNPPYIRSDVIPTLMPEVRDHEPRTALDGDADGLRFYRVIAREASSYLKRRGRLYLETGYDEAEAVTGLLKENGFTDVEALKDYSGNYRVIKCCRGDR